VRHALLLAVLARAAAARGAADPPAPGIYAPAGQSGKALYGGNCALCHGPDGKGLPKRGPSLRDVGALSADFYLRTGYMPLHSPTTQPWRSPVLFDESELRALIAYVASFGGPPVPQPHPERGSLADGRRLFTQNCAGCHQAVAEGGYVVDARVPPLKEATATQVAEAVRVGPYVMPSFSQRQLSDRQLDSIVRYVEWAKHPDDRGGWGIGHIGPVPEGIVAWWIGAAALVALCLLLGRRLRAAG
jgi:ubiquinol-cytochrome c reductase cytochrome c subunit